MKSYYRTTTTIEHPSFPDGYKTECFSQRFVDDLHNMDIITHYTKDEEPRDDEYKNSPHVLINISQEHYNKLKSIETDVNKKYFEMGGDNENGWNGVSQMVLELFEKGFENEVHNEDYTEKQYREVEEEIVEQHRREETNKS